MNDGVYDYAKDHDVPCVGASLCRDGQMVHVDWTVGGARWSCPTSWCRQAVTEQTVDSRDVRLILKFVPPSADGSDVGLVVVRLTVQQQDAWRATDFVEQLKDELRLPDEDMEDVAESEDADDAEETDGADGREPHSPSAAPADTAARTEAVAGSDVWIVFDVGPEDKELLAEVRRRGRHGTP